MLFCNEFNATRGQGVDSLLKMFFLQIWVHFHLKDQANYIRYNSSNILLYLIGATKAKKYVKV